MEEKSSLQSSIPSSGAVSGSASGGEPKVPPYKEYAYYPHNKILFVLEQHREHDNFGSLDATTFFEYMNLDLQTAQFEHEQYSDLMNLVSKITPVSPYAKKGNLPKPPRRQLHLDQAEPSGRLDKKPEDVIRFRTAKDTYLMIFQGYIDNVSAIMSEPKIAPLGTVINFIYQAIDTWQPSISSKRKPNFGSLPAQSAENSDDTPPSTPPIWNLGQYQKKQEKRNFGNILLVTPDWLGGNSSINGSQTPTGGPESHPLPVPTSPAPNLQYPLPASFMRKIRPPTGRKPQSVDVYILDTLPGFENIRMRHDWLEDHHPDHNPLRRFLGAGKLGSLASKPDGSVITPGTNPPRFRVNNREFHYVSTLPNCDMNSFKGVILSNNDYPMPDHGLFIAGVISSIVNNPPSVGLPPGSVKYHLIQVLNDYGIGTISTMLAGLEQVHELMDPNHPSIINCSFTLSLPIDDHIDDDLDAEMTTLLNGTFFRALLIAIIDSIFTSATIPVTGQIPSKPNCLVVAAAGNDSNDLRRDGTVPTNPLQPRYPAAASTVVGVGACDINRQLTNYTNFADIPNKAELYAFGGAPGGEMVGLFISNPFPTAVSGMAAANTNGLAYWTGTSFAAPIISGALALYCTCNHVSVHEALQVVRDCTVNNIFM